MRTYVMFFPQLVAGPIERPQNLLHQFREWHHFNYGDVTSGLKRMAWGFYKKLVVADRLAFYVNDVYGAPRNYNGLQLTLATFFLPIRSIAISQAILISPLALRKCWAFG